MSANLNVVDKVITTGTTNGNVKLEPNGSGAIEIRGASSNDGVLQLNCSNNSHGVKIKSPPHSAAANYTLTLPDDTGTNGQVLETDGSGNLSWATAGGSSGVFESTDHKTFTASTATHTIVENEYTTIRASNTELTLKLSTPVATTFYSEVDVYNYQDTNSSNIIISNNTGSDLTVINELLLNSSLMEQTVANSGTLNVAVSRRSNFKFVRIASGAIRIYVTENTSQGFGNLQFISATASSSRTLYPGTHFHNTSTSSGTAYTLPESSSLTGPVFFGLSMTATSGSYSVSLSAADISGGKRLYYSGSTWSTSITLSLGKGRVEYILFDGSNFRFITNPVKGPFIPQEYEEGSALSIGSSDEDKLFFLTDSSGSVETVTLPLLSTIDDGAIFTINTARSSSVDSTAGNQTSRLLFDLHNTDRTSNDSSDAVYIWFNQEVNYQTSVSAGTRDANDAYTESKAYFWRNGTPIYVIKTSSGYRIYGQAAYAEPALPNVMWSTNFSFFYRNAWNITNGTTNSNDMALPDLTTLELEYGLPDGTSCITAKKGLGVNDISHPVNTITHTTNKIYSTRNGISSLATLNSSTGLYEYETKARQAKFLKRDDAWWLVEEVGGINPCSLLERHADGSYHILGDESSTAGGLKVYNESNTYASWLKAPLAADLSADVDFVLPASEGTNGQLLQTDGSGNTSWVTAGGASRPAVTLDNSGTNSTISISSSSVLEDIYLVDNGSAAVTITLPTAANNAGYKVQIKRLGSANVTVSAGTATIDGVSSQVLSVQYSSFTLTTDGTNWYII